MPERKSQPGTPGRVPDDESAKSAEDTTAARHKKQQPRPYQDIIDDTLDDSFPASDPPFWAGH